MKNKIQNLLQQSINQKIFPGCVVSVISKNQTINFGVGYQTYEDNSKAVTNNTIYDIASVTKFLTAILALQLIEVGKIALETKLSDVLVQTKNQPTANLTIKDLLTSLPNFHYALSQSKDLPANKILEQIFSAKWEDQRDKEVTFTNTSFILLGMVVETISKKGLADLVNEKIFQPLQMYSTSWGRTSDIEATAPSEIDDWRGREIKGEIHDESAWKLFQQLNMCVGSAGVFSTIADMTKLVKSFINQKDDRLLSDKFKKMMVQNHLLDVNMDSGLGLEINKNWMGENKKSLVGKTGFTGSMIVFDQDLNQGLVMLSNATYPTRPEDRSLLLALRQQLCDIIFDFLTI